jgi:hypothetical protein
MSLVRRLAKIFKVAFIEAIRNTRWLIQKEKINQRIAIC